MKINKNIYWIISYLIVCSICVYIQLNYVAREQILIQNVPEVLKEEMLETISEYGRISYILSPLIILVRILYTSLCLFIGGVLIENCDKKNFSNCFSIALKADCIFIVSSLVVALLCLSLGYEDATKIYSNFSLLKFFNVNDLDLWLITILSVFNAFEIIYWIILALLLTSKMQKFKKSIGFVISTYVIGFIFYVIILIYLSVYMTNE